MLLSFTLPGRRTALILLALLVQCVLYAPAQTSHPAAAMPEKPLVVRAGGLAAAAFPTPVRQLKREKKQMQKLESLFRSRAAATNAPLSELEANARQKNAQLLKALTGRLDSLQSLRSRVRNLANRGEALRGKAASYGSRANRATVPGMAGAEKLREAAARQPVPLLRPDSAALASLGREVIRRTRYGQALTALEGQANPLAQHPAGQLADQLGEAVAAAQHKEQLQQFARAKAAKLATAEFAALAPQLQEARQKFARYKRKMAWLKEGSGPRANSLKDAPLSERLIYGGNVQIAALEPLSVVAAPFIGYRLNAKIAAGARFSCNWVVGKNAPGTKTFGGEMGYSGFVDYRLPVTWFARGEFERMRKAVPNPTRDGYVTTWQSNAYLGVGRQISATKRYQVTTVFLCNLLHPNLNRLDPDAFQFRICITR